MWKIDENGAEVIPTTGWNNCGGRCIIRAHRKDGKVVKISTETQSEAGDRPALTACVKGMNYHKTFLSENRLTHPLKRVGERGSGEFERISWEEALDIIASEWIRIRDTYGVGSRYSVYATGVGGLLRGTDLITRLLSADGGYLEYYNSYSSACVAYTTPYLYGTYFVGNSFDTILDSEMIILLGHNPSETGFNRNLMYYLKKAKEKGIEIVGVDPRKSDTISQLSSEWMPIRPATDAALCDAMAYVIYTENLYDKNFTEKYCIGFDENTMPEGVDKSLNYFAYLRGEADNTPKTPAWGEKITGIPAEDIIRLARKYATSKPAALIPGYGIQRHGNGEQATRGAIMLACLTGNVGVSGGWAGGIGVIKTPPVPGLPYCQNPHKMAIPTFLWTEAIERGTELTSLDGITGGEKLESNIKMIINLAGNTLINQHSDINKTAEILKDTSKCEFIVTSDLFMTASAKYSDIVLPGTSMFETENITYGWQNADYFGFNNKVIEPIGECRFEFDWLVDLSERLGLKEEFTKGKYTMHEWLSESYNQLREKNPELPEYEEFKRRGIHIYPESKNVVSLKPQIEDPENNPFPTPSGKIEIFSERIYNQEHKEFVPPIPMYVPAKEGHEDPLSKKYPLQLIGWHTKRRCHTIHDSNTDMHKIDPQALWINPEDAKERGITQGQNVLVHNHRGKIEIPVNITDKIVKGVVALSQGAWYAPDKDGADKGGSINVLTSQIPTPFAKANPQHTNLVEVSVI